MKNLIYKSTTIKELTLSESIEIQGGWLANKVKEFNGSWWCVFCWIDYVYE